MMAIGPRSPRSVSTRINNMNMVCSEVIDNVGQQSPRSTPFGIDDEYMARGEVIDNVGQRSSQSLQSRVDDIRILVNDLPGLYSLELMI